MPNFSPAWSRRASRLGRSLRSVTHSTPWRIANPHRAMTALPCAWPCCTRQPSPFPAFNCPSCRARCARDRARARSRHGRPTGHRPGGDAGCGPIWMGERTARCRGLGVLRDLRRRRAEQRLCRHHHRLRDLGFAAGRGSATRRRLRAARARRARARLWLGAAVGLGGLHLRQSGRRACARTSRRIQPDLDAGCRARGNCAECDRPGAASAGRTPRRGAEIARAFAVALARLRRLGCGDEPHPGESCSIPRLCQPAMGGQGPRRSGHRCAVGNRRARRDRLVCRVRPNHGANSPDRSDRFGRASAPPCAGR